MKMEQGELEAAKDRLREISGMVQQHLGDSVSMFAVLESQSEQGTSALKCIEVKRNDDTLEFDRHLFEALWRHIRTRNLPMPISGKRWRIRIRLLSLTLISLSAMKKKGLADRYWSFAKKRCIWPRTMNLVKSFQWMISIGCWESCFGML